MKSLLTMAAISCLSNIANAKEIVHCDYIKARKEAKEVAISLAKGLNGATKISEPSSEFDSGSKLNLFTFMVYYGDSPETLGAIAIEKKTCKSARTSMDGFSKHERIAIK